MCVCECFLWVCEYVHVGVGGHCPCLCLYAPVRSSCGRLLHITALTVRCLAGPPRCLILKIAESASLSDIIYNLSFYPQSSTAVCCFFGEWMGVRWRISGIVSCKLSSHSWVSYQSKTATHHSLKMTLQNKGQYFKTESINIKHLLSFYITFSWALRPLWAITACDVADVTIMSI